MNHLTNAERLELLALIGAGQPLPQKWRQQLFSATPRAVEIGKRYRLEYQGKRRPDAVMAHRDAGRLDRLDPLG